MRLFYLIIIVLWILIQNSYAKEQLKFEHYTRSNGLPNNSVNSIYKDSRGFMWFCTDGGLVRYDGYNFITYQHDSSDSSSLSDDYVICICEDETGKFWVGTRNGLNLFDPIHDKIERINLDENTSNDTQFNWVTAIESCKAGGVWIASRSGLYRVIPDSMQISWFNQQISTQYLYKYNNVSMIHYTYTANDDNSLNDNGLYCLYEDKNGILWIGSDNGGQLQGALHKLLPGTKTDYPPFFKKYVHDDEKSDTSVGRYLQSIHEDRFGNIWIGTWQEGLFRLDPISGKIKRFFKHKKTENLNDINCNNIYSMTEDNHGNLWITTYGGGLNEIEADNLDSDNPIFIHYLDDPENEKGLTYQNLRTIYFDKYDQLWIGSLGNGIYKTRLDMPYKVIEHNNNPNSLSDNHVNYIFEDSNGDVWIVTKDGILNLWMKETNQFKHYRLGKNKEEKIYNFPYITETNKNLLVAFENSIKRLDFKTRTITDFIKEINLPDSLLKINSAFQAIYIDTNDNLLISNSNFRVLVQKTKSSYNFRVLPLPDFLTSFRDSKSNIWFSTRFEGLYTFNQSYILLSSFVYKRLVYNSGYGFVETEDSLLWASTSRGLFKYNLQTKKYKYFEEKDGLGSNDTRGILKDDHGYIWLSTDCGISRFDPETKKISNLNSTNGLPITNFNRRTYCKGKNGEFYFGSDQGILTFHPDSVHFNCIPPAVFITDLKVFNKEVDIGEEIDGSVILNKTITYADAITLSYKSNVLQFEFAALNYLLPEENKYAYKMEGVDKEWNFVNADRRFTTYAGLQYGEYIFRVKASNNNSVWNENGRSLKIIILSPWWQTWWFRFIVFIIIAICIVGLHKLRTYQIKQNNLKLERRVIDRTARLELANRELESFAYSVSHDLRTPLRSIDGFSQILLEEYQEKINDTGKEYLIRVRNAAQRMGHLIDDMLRLSHVSRLDMKIEKVNLSELVHNIVSELQSRSPNRQVNFVIQEDIVVHGDKRLMQIALDNLIENAWKFTSKNLVAKIEFGAVSKNSKQIYYIKDNGIGFNMQYGQKLFKAFQRLHNSSDFPGIGIGLAIVQRVINRHGGRVWANSELEKGATFYFTLPIHSQQEN